MGFLDFFEYIDHRPFWKKERCLRYLSARSECRKCADTCYINQICFKENEVILENSCDSCGACSEYCPTNALVPVEREFKITEGKIYISFEKDFRFQDQPLFFSNSCYFSIDAISRFYMQGVRKFVIIGEWEKNNLLTSIDKVNQVLEWKKKEKIEIEELTLEEWKEEKKNLPKFVDTICSRREMFQNYSKETTSIIKQVLGYKSAQKPMAIRLLQECNPFSSKRIGLCSIKLEKEKCVSCEACVKLCPEGARKEQSGEIVHLHEKCIACGLCIEICPERALEIKRKIYWSR